MGRPHQKEVLPDYTWGQEGERIDPIHWHLPQSARMQIDFLIRRNPLVDGFGDPSITLKEGDIVILPQDTLVTIHDVKKFYSDKCPADTLISVSTVANEQRCNGNILKGDFFPKKHEDPKQGKLF